MLYINKPVCLEKIPQVEANLQNLQPRQASLFSDQAANNAASQFNATSTNQVDQFYKNLSSNVSTA